MFIEICSFLVATGIHSLSAGG